MPANKFLFQRKKCTQVFFLIDKFCNQFSNIRFRQTSLFIFVAHNNCTKNSVNDNNDMLKSI